MARNIDQCGSDGVYLVRKVSSISVQEAEGKTLDRWSVNCRAETHRHIYIKPPGSLDFPIHLTCLSTE